MLKPYYASEQGDFLLYLGACEKILSRLPEFGSIPLIFADPPYFLSRDGITCQSGKMVLVNKGYWDRLLKDIRKIHQFNIQWLKLCQDALSPNGTIWVSGTRHIIYSIGFAMQELGFKLLNEITWVKPNPPPNLSCRYFTHSTETILWAAKNHKSKHTFNYGMVKEMANGKQMKSVWIIPAAGKSEKIYGKHPAQKPEELLTRIILASSLENDLVLDPFCGCGTTGVVAVRLGRKFIGIDIDRNFLDISIKRFIGSKEAVKVLAN